MNFAHQLSQPYERSGEFVSASHKLQKPHDIVQLLQFLADLCDAEGVIFWRLAPGSKLEAGQKQGRLFPVASWCGLEGVKPWYYLPVDSVTGNAWLNRAEADYHLVPSIEDARDISDEARDLLLNNWKMISCAAVPVQGSPVPSVVTFYKRTVIDVDKLAKSCSVVQLLPVMYSLAGHRQSLYFLTQVNETLNPPGSRKPSEFEDARRRLKAVCELINNHFDATETSLFLKEQFGQAVYRYQEGVWKWQASRYCNEYTEGQGLTGWVLREGRPLRIPDLARFDDDRAWIQHEYPNLDWQDLLDIKSQLRVSFGMPDAKDRDLPLASFVCVPVTHGTVLGALRCSTRTSSPWPFEERDTEMLSLAAAYISGWWADLLEYRQLRGIVDSLNNLHKVASKHLLGLSSNKEQVLLTESLRRAMDAVPEVSAGSVRLVDSHQNLYFQVIKGSAKDRVDRREFLDPSSRDGGVRAVLERNAVIENASQGRLHIPIMGVDNPLGVLELVRGSNWNLLEHDQKVAELFAGQIGLYLHLSREMEKRLAVQNQLRAQQKTQLETFDMLRHQIYGPVGTAAMTLTRLLGSPEVARLAAKDLILAREDMLRASIMVRSLDLFASLAASRSLRVKPERLTSARLRSRLEAMIDYQAALASPDRDLKFTRKISGVEVLDEWVVECDFNLLEHALHNLMDNARKYTRKKGTVAVVCGTMANFSLFYIAVNNTGFKIAKTDVARMVEQGWRSDEAVRLVAEGQGLGLYLVKAIMKAHNGDLQIMPTSSNGVNDLRLAFPIGGTPQWPDR